MRKRVNDPLHGAVFLDDIEFQIASTPTFLRLANVKQLGLGAHIYPGAGYSRHEHSIGACHLVGRMLDAIEANTGKRVTTADRRITRIAALLHDLGHYPYSHATEEVVETLGAPSVLKVAGKIGPTNAGKRYFTDHEELGQYLIQNDPQITKILRNNKIDPADVAARLKADATNLKLLISSDLDCDRLDYLRRTALHAGLPFGGVDADYLIDNLLLDDAGIPCIRPKAIGSADHFLLSRLYDFEQLPFHKAVVGFEEALKITLLEMAKLGTINLDRMAIEAAIAAGTWRRFDDQLVLAKIREFSDAARSMGGYEDTLPFVDALLDRKAPKLVFAYEYLDQLNDETNAVFETRRAQIAAAAETVFARHGISSKLTFIWEKKFPVLKGKETGQRVRVGRRDASGVLRSWSIDKELATLCRRFDGFGMRHIRVYACLNGARHPKELRDTLKIEIQSELTSGLFSDLRRLVGEENDEDHGSA